MLVHVHAPSLPLSQLKKQTLQAECTALELGALARSRPSTDKAVQATEVNGLLRLHTQFPAQVGPKLDLGATLGGDTSM